MLFFPPAFSEPMTSQETALEVLVTASLVADWGQTLNIVHRQGQGVDVHESNPILGARPSRGAVNRYFATAILLNHFLIRALPHAWRTRVLAGTLMLQLAVTGENTCLGLGVRF